MLAAGGALLVVIATVDSLWTALWVDRAAGPVTSRATTLAWRAAHSLFGRRHPVLSALGPLILVTTVLAWVIMLWAGWVLLFSADPDSLISTRNLSPADWSDRIWFVAYAMFTMGNGDFFPANGIWQLVSALATGSGLFLVTMAITYLLAVVSAVAAKRAFAASVHHLGRSGTEFVLAGWDGHDLRSLEHHVAHLAAQLAEITEGYLAYPVLQYYHSRRAEKSPVLAVGVFDDALTLLCFGVAPELRPGPAAITAARSAVSGFLDTLQPAFVRAAPSPPPGPRLTLLAGEGIDVVAEREFRNAVDGLTERRKKILGLVRNDGWEWWKD